MTSRHEDWEHEHYARLVKNNPHLLEPKHDPHAELRVNDLTLPAILGNNTMQTDKFVGLRHKEIDVE